MTLVAVIDDDSGIRDSLKLLLELSGHEVATFDSATAFLTDRAIRPACLIVDHQMPGMTGLELARRLHSEGANIPVLLLSGAVTLTLISNAAQFGIRTVLLKPSKLDDLLKFIDENC